MSNLRELRAKNPLPGNIACGKPIFENEELGEYVYFCPHAQSDSRIGARIYDVDIGFVRQQESAEHGRIAAVFIEAEAFIKRVRYGRGGDVVSIPGKLAMQGDALLQRSIGILGKAVTFHQSEINKRKEAYTMGIRDTLRRLRHFWVNGFDYSNANEKEYDEPPEMDGAEETTFASREDEPRSSDKTNEANADTGEHSAGHSYTEEKIPERKNKAFPNGFPETDNRQTANENADSIPNSDASWRIYTHDMLQFVAIPYDMSDPIHNSVDESGNPFACIPICNSSHNIDVAWKHIGLLNRIVSENRDKLQKFLGDLRMDREEVDGLVLICTPYTSKGRLARIPVSLKFVSPSVAEHHKIEGFIHYRSNGKIQDANVIVHRKISDWSQYDAFDPFHNAHEFSTRFLEQKFTFVCINGRLELYKAFQCTRSGNESVTDEYKHELLIEREQEKERDLHCYAYLKALLPEQCPKSFGAYRRMRALKTKKYEEICSMLEDKLLCNLK